MSGSAYSRRAKTALILASDSLGAALVGAATELAGFRVVFSRAGESVPDAIRRARPLVVLVEAGDDPPIDSASLGPALMTGAALLYFGPATRLRDLRSVTSATRAEVLAFPDDIARLPEVLTRLVARSGRTSFSE